jgi:hypothetical protein
MFILYDIVRCTNTSEPRGIRVFNTKFLKSDIPEILRYNLEYLSPYTDRLGATGVWFPTGQEIFLCATASRPTWGPGSLLSKRSRGPFPLSPERERMISRGGFEIKWSWPTRGTVHVFDWRDGRKPREISGYSVYQQRFELCTSLMQLSSITFKPVCSVPHICIKKRLQRK